MTAPKKSPVEFASATPNPNFPAIRDIAPDELVKMVDSVHIIDVRMPDEYTGELGHIAGSKLIVLQTIPEHIDELPKDETIVFVCRSGGRSAQAAAYARDNGIQRVFNMKGGMLRWNELGLPIEL